MLSCVHSAPIYTEVGRGGGGGGEGGERREVREWRVQGGCEMGMGNVFWRERYLSKDASVSIPAVQLGNCVFEVPSIQRPVILMPESIFDHPRWQNIGPFC